MSEEDLILGNLLRAIYIIEDCPEFALIIPEVRVNLVYAKKEAKEKMDVAGIDGRITVVGGKPKASGYPKFGASDHMARTILEIMKYDKDIRAGINFAWNEKLSNVTLKYAKENGLEYVSINRFEEPKNIKEIEGKSIPWKIEYIVRKNKGKIPRIFYESADMGKEPLTVVVGKDAIEVTNIAISIAKLYSKILKD